MSHNLGSVITLGSPVVIGPAAGPPTTPPNIWAYSFPVDPAAKYVMLHFTGVSLGAADHIEVDLGYDTDHYDPSWGPDYWSRPIKGGAPINVRYVRGGGAGSPSVTLDQYMRGEALIGDGSAKANGDMFLIDSPFVAPTVQFAAGKYPPGSAPTWENVACPLPAVITNTARSVGMYVHRDGSMVSSCTCTLIAPDLIITAGHCMATDEDAKTGSVTFDFQTNCDGTRPSGYNPRFYKLKRVVRQGFARASGDLRPLSITAFFNSSRRQEVLACLQFPFATTFRRWTSRCSSSITRAASPRRCRATRSMRHARCWPAATKAKSISDAISITAARGRPYSIPADASLRISAFGMGAPACWR